MSRFIFSLIILVFLAVILEIYSFQAFKTVSKNKLIRFGFLAASILVYINFFITVLSYDRKNGQTPQFQMSMGLVLTFLIPKLLILIILFGEDIYRFTVKLISSISNSETQTIPGRRKFMKIMGGLATIPFVGKFFKGAKTAAPAVEKAAEVAGQAPSYFFDLVAKIKMLGKSGISTGPRQNTMNYKNYELMEDVSTGDLRITKRDPKYAQEEVLEYRKGQRTEDGVIPDEYEEVTIRADMDGKMKDFDVGIEEDTIKEIVEETTKEAPSIKKADGGIAMMLGE